MNIWLKVMSLILFIGGMIGFCFPLYRYTDWIGVVCFIIYSAGILWMLNAVEEPIGQDAKPQNKMKLEVYEAEEKPKEASKEEPKPEAKEEPKEKMKDMPIECPKCHSERIWPFGGNGKAQCHDCEHTWEY